MTTRPKDLPDFECPPVSEVAFSIQFATEHQLNGIHIGQYYPTIRADYPRYEEYPPLPSVQESENPWAPTPSNQPQFLDTPPLRRCWFLDSDGNKVIQIQPDRFAHNWRKLPGAKPYPHYEAICSSFLQHWDKFAAFLETQQLGKPKISLAELIYVNHIEKDGCWSEIGDAVPLFSFLSSEGSSGFLPKPENFSWNRTYRLPEKKGRLYINVQPALRTVDTKQIIQMSLTVHGPLGGELQRSDMEDWFKTAREWIVKGFADATTERAHACWKRTQ